MSQDLFAAFGSQNDAASGTTAANDPRTENAHYSDLFSNTDRTQVSQSVPVVGDEDDFGDFEDASATPTTAPSSGSGYPPPKTSVTHATHSSKVPPAREPAKPATDAGSHPFAGNMDILFAADDDEYDAGQDEMDDIANNPEAAMAYSKRIIAEQQNAQERSAKVAAAGPSRSAFNTSPQKPSPKEDLRTLQKRPGHATTRDPNVLFDADDVSEHAESDDDFGDFEGDNWFTEKKIANATPAKAEPTSMMPNIDLLGLDDSMTAPAQPASTHMDRTAVVSRPEDGWDDFEMPEAEPSAPNTTSKRNAAVGSQRTSIKSPAESNKTADTKSLPPTNVPPPAVLLSVFPSIFSSAQDALFKPMGKLDLKQRQMLLAHPATRMFLKSYLTLGIVLGHIIAGRRLRWKRDQYLAQGMRIGPSAAGGKGGMKLAGIDKGETTKEEREVLDAVTMWKGQVGKLRTAVASASAAPKTSKLPPVPEIAETMPVRTLKATEGGFTAPHACALCGLKREERVAKVDVEVDDSFGEWWLDSMSMHVVCRNFWEEHKNKLKSR